MRVRAVLTVLAVLILAGAAHAAKSAKPARDAAPKPVAITGVQQFSGKDYSRIVLLLSGQTGRRWQLLPPDPKAGDVRRLYVDLDNTVVRPGVPSHLTISDGIMRKVRVAPYKPGVTRVVVDIENFKNCQVFALDNPVRVILDVQGEMKKAPAQPEKPAKSGSRATSGSKGKPAPEAKASAGYTPPPGSKRMAKTLVEQLGLGVRTVMIDPGHGGVDPGARGHGGILEKNVTLNAARLLGARLTAQGFTVLYTRTADKTVPLVARTAMANAKKADLFISLHCNAHKDPKSSGLETYSLNLASTPDEVRVAARENAGAMKNISDLQKILDELMHTSKLDESRELAKAAHSGALGQARKSLDLRDRGLHEAPFHVLMGAKMPAVLVEMGYITNPAEAAKLGDKAYLDSLARGLAEGVAAYKQRVERYAASQ